VFHRAYNAEITAQLSPEAIAAFSGPAAAVHVQTHKAWLDNDEHRRRLQARMAALFLDVDALVCPVTPRPAIEHRHDGTPDDRRVEIDGTDIPYWGLASWCSLAMVARTPAISVPIAPAPSGLPIAAQVLGPYLEDHTALAAARLVADGTNGGYRIPPGWCAERGEP
jgi:amidase